MLTRSRPAHGSASLMPRGAVAVRFSVNSVSTRSACAVAYAHRVRDRQGRGHARQHHQEGPHGHGQPAGPCGTGHAYVASTLTAQTPSATPSTTDTLRSRAGSVASSTRVRTSRRVASR